MQAKQRLAWLALRAARDDHLQHFGKIKNADIALLAQAIEEKRLEREKEADANGGVQGISARATSGSAGEMERSTSPVGKGDVGQQGSQDGAEGKQVGDVEGAEDVKMDTGR